MRTIAAEALPQLLESNERINEMLRRHGRDEVSVHVDLADDPYFLDETTDDTTCGHCATARAAAESSYGRVMAAVIEDGWVRVDFDEVCITVKFPFGHTVPVQHGEGVDWPVPGTRCPGIDGIVVASIVFIDDERGLFHLVLSVNDEQPGQHYLVGEYEALDDGEWRLHAPMSGFPDEIPGCPGRYPNIVPAVHAYTQCGGDY